MGSIYVGTNKIKKIYVGTTPVKKVYVGTKLVWSANETGYWNSTDLVNVLVEIIFILLSILRCLRKIMPTIE